MDILASLKDSASSSPTTVLAGSENQVTASYADEVMVVTETWDHAARLKSCRLDAEVRKRNKFAKTQWPKNRHFNRVESVPG
jgi:hypothetical protein